MVRKIKHFEWDTDKNKANLQKHGVTFREAESVFYDKYAVVADDDEHSKDEDRFVIVGNSKKSRILLACYCVRNGDTVRIISARKATESEIDWYKEGRQ
ncbi:MAG: BrnT family toxin [Defluviitaleaceae bacterium]|nr:BrnT family toxin [Defluviitaleaceae bacterium]MCL2263755.1 BrnT family toxin [Defluviitaleaceae bacterium]